MVTDQEYAQLSARAYAATNPNKIALGDWTELEWLPDRSYGFSVGVYKKGNDIVISYAGTNEAADWGWANGLVSLGLPSPQVMEAMLLYITTKRDNPGANITFTGHSLGGGLASMMAVFFDRPATVFDHAPFELGAVNLVTLGIYRAELIALAFSDPSFDNYSPSVFSAREAQVRGIHLKGEALEVGRAAGTEITGTALPPVDPGSPVGATAVNLHSMILLASMMTSTAFASAVRAQPGLIALLLDGSLYKFNAKTSSDPDLLTLLYSKQVGSSTTPLLDRFAADLLRLTTDPDGMAAQSSVLKALTVAAMEYYYFKDATATTALFTSDANGIHFKLSDISGNPTSLKSPDLLATATRLFLDTTEQSELPVSVLKTGEAWHVQSGTSGMTWTAGAGFARDIVVGGAQTDILDGGGGADILIGGAGADFLTGGTGTDTLLGGFDSDVLNGGTGNDRLIGGSGADIYQFTTGDGADTVVDSDGLGSIVLNGNTLSMAKAAGKTNTWKDENGVVYRFTRKESDTLGWLTITGATLTDSITINNFDLAKATNTGGYLGITLDNSVKVAINDQPGVNYWASHSDTSSLTGKGSDEVEGGGEALAISLSAGAKEGDTITLAIATNPDNFDVILGNSRVPANGAVITLTEGQTDVRISLVQTGDITADINTTISATYTSVDPLANPPTTSNSWAINVKDGGDPSHTFIGDQRGKLVGNAGVNEVAMHLIAACAYSTRSRGRFFLKLPCNPSTHRSHGHAAIPTRSRSNLST